MFDSDIKYIVADGVGYVIPETGITHAEYADALNIDRERIQGAGFVVYDDFGMPTCRGESISLRISSSEDDSDTMKRATGMNNYCCVYGREQYDEVVEELNQLKKSKEKHGKQ